MEGVCSAAVFMPSRWTSGHSDDAGLDGLGEFVDSAAPPCWVWFRHCRLEVRPSAEEIVAAAAAAVTDRSASRGRCWERGSAISPTCGLAGATAAWARVATGCPNGPRRRSPTTRCDLSHRCPPSERQRRRSSSSRLRHRALNALG